MDTNNLKIYFSSPVQHKEEEEIVDAFVSLSRMKHFQVKVNKATLHEENNIHNNHTNCYI